MKELLKEITELKQLNLLGVKKALSTTDVANLTGLSKAYIYKMVSNRAIPFYKSKGGKCTYFKTDDVIDWMLANRYPSRDEVEQEAEAKVLNLKK